jgi:DNA mismatch endonuclease (patch repair protein)
VADIVSKRKRSQMMSGIKGRNTKPEVFVRSYLHRAGLRFRLHDRKLPGRPDIVLARYRTVILVHGCFWHRHKGCKFCYTPKSNRAFWKAKFAANVERDVRKARELRRAGWRVVTIWECRITPKDLQRLEKKIRS